MKTEYKYISFRLVKQLEKTSRWVIVNNESEECIGEIKWYSAWRRYCFFTNDGMIFDQSCLRDIIDFIQQLSAAREIGAAKNGLTTAANRNG
jgi:hypothetical protein